MFCKKSALKNFAKFSEKTPAQHYFLIFLLFCNFIWKDTLAPVFWCEFYKISKNTFLYRQPPMVASVACWRKLAILIFTQTQKSGASLVCIIFPEITQKILTTDIFHRLELITEILSFQQIFSLTKTTTQFFLTFQKIWKKINKMLYFWHILSI